MSQMCLSKEIWRVGCVCLCKHYVCVCVCVQTVQIIVCIYHVVFFIIIIIFFSWLFFDFSERV